MRLEEVMAEVGIRSSGGGRIREGALSAVCPDCGKESVLTDLSIEESDEGAPLTTTYSCSCGAVAIGIDWSEMGKWTNYMLKGDSEEVYVLSITKALYLPGAEATRVLMPGGPKS